MQCEPLSKIILIQGMKMNSVWGQLLPHNYPAKTDKGTRGAFQDDLMENIFENLLLVAGRCFDVPR